MPQPLGTEDQTHINSEDTAGMPLPEITLCMFVKNEGATLKDVIARVFDVVSEIVIGVDAASTDDTMEIAQAAVQAKGRGICYAFAWRNNFAEQRNLTLKRAKGKYALILDGHEFVEDAGLVADAARALEYSTQRMNNGMPVRDVPFASFKTVMMDHAGRDELMHPRLLRMSANPRYVGIMHHRIQTDAGPDVPSIAFDNIRLFHNRTKANALERAQQRREMAVPWAESLITSDDVIQQRRGLFYLAAHYATHIPELGIAQNPAAALHYVDKFVASIGEPRDRESMLALYMGWKVQYAWERDDSEHALDWAKGRTAEARAWEMIHIRQDMPQPFLALWQVTFDAYECAAIMREDAADDDSRAAADALCSVLLARAEWACRAASGHPFETGANADSRSLYTYVPLANLARVYAAGGRLHDAAEAARAAMAYDDLPDALRAELCANITIWEQQLQTAVSPVLRSDDQTRIAVFDKIGSFSGPFADALDALPDVEVIRCDAFDPTVMNRVHVAYFDWCDDLLVEATARQPWHARIVAHAHSYEAFGSEAVARVNWAQVDELWSVHPLVLQLMGLSGAPNADRIVQRVLPLGVDLDRFTFSVERDCDRVAVVGYLNMKKGPQALMGAIAALTRDGLEVHIAGRFQDPRTQLYVTHAVAAWDLERVHWHGWQQDVNAWLDEVNPAWMLSGSLFESGPKCTVEAAAKGIIPLVHAYPGAEWWHKAKWLWRDTKDLLGLCNGRWADLHRLSQRLRASEARDYVAKTRDARVCTQARVDAILTLASLGQRDAKQTTVLHDPLTSAFVPEAA